MSFVFISLYFLHKENYIFSIKTKNIMNWRKKMLYDVSLEILQKCLNNCLHCSSNSCNNSKMILGLDTIKQIIDDIIFIGAKRLCLSGGEPFLHPDILEMIEYATKKGLIVDIYSSGIIGEHNFEKPISKEMLLECKKRGLNRIMFNVQAADPVVYDTIMGTNGKYDLLIQSISNSKECQIDTEIHFVPMKQNYNQVTNVMKLAEQLNVCCVSFLRLVPHGRAKDNKEKIMLSDEELRSLQKELYYLKETRKNVRIGLPLSCADVETKCHAVREKLYIKFDGNVYGCEAFKYLKFFTEDMKEIIPDNVLDNRIREIYNNSLFLDKSIELVDKYSENCIGCENCPVQKFLRNER